MLIRDLFRADVTRNIPPVVYFHEQSPEKLAAEVSEYIVTGGWPEDHPHRRRVPVGVHEAYVRLLDGIAAELDAPHGVNLPNVWISGFYGSGKSSFAKLLGLALDGARLPDGRSLAQALLERDASPRAAELRRAWDRLLQKVEPLSVVFDVGNAARNDEHIHAVAVRQVQTKLGYSSKSHHVAFAELDLEREGRWAELQRASQAMFQKPWEALKDAPMAAAYFSRLMAQLYPQAFQGDKDWHMRHTGSDALSMSASEALKALQDMLAFRKPRATLFLVMDEVSQYVLAHNDRVERLRAFAEGLGAMRGKVWLFALGQQQLDAAAQDSFLVKTKDRFPHHLRVHLAPTNIRDVVHKRLLHKKDEAVPALRELFERNRAALKLYAYKCEDITADDFVEAYPLLPSQLELILDLTTALRSRSKRVQGDAQAIRGLLQLLGELFRAQRLADAPVGQLIGIDQVYEIQQSALDADQQSSMARLLERCKDGDELTLRAAKAVALLELIQSDELPTKAALVAQCLYDRVDLGDNVAAVTEALEGLRRRNLLGYSEKTGYKLQSQAGEEWERERRDVGVSREAVCEYVQESLRRAMANPDRPTLGKRPFPWAAVFSDAYRAQDVPLLAPRDEAVVRVDLRFLPREEREEAAWIRKSAESALAQRLVWVAAEVEEVEELARELGRSEHMVKLYKPRRESLPGAQKMLLQGEENRAEDLRGAVLKAVEAAWARGRMYFQGGVLAHTSVGFAKALSEAGQALLPKLYPHFKDISVLPSELEQLLAPVLSGPSPKFLSGDLGLLELDAGHYVPACGGAIPKAVQAYIEQGGAAGSALLAHFSGPPYAYRAEAVMACVAGLLRASKVRVQPESGGEITSIRDAGVKDVLTKEREFRQARFFAAQSEVSPQTLARLCKFFEEVLKIKLQREEPAVADAVAAHFPGLAQRLRAVRDRLASLPQPPALPDALVKLGPLLDDAIRQCRQTRPTVLLLKQHLDALREGVVKLQIYDAELTPSALDAVREAHRALVTHGAQLRLLGLAATDVQDALARLERQLGAERPWVEVAALDPDLHAIREAYCAERARLLVQQGEAADAVRASLRQRSGFSLLSADQAHEVLRHISAALDTSTPDATSPSLLDLKDPFALRLQRAEREAHATFEALMDDKDKDKRPFVRVELQVQNREISTEAELDLFLAELRHRLLAPLQAHKRVRLG